MSMKTTLRRKEEDVRLIYVIVGYENADRRFLCQHFIENFLI